MRIWAYIYIHMYIHTHSTYTCDPEVYYCLLSLFSHYMIMYMCFSRSTPT